VDDLAHCALAMSFTPADSRTFFAVAGYAYAWRFL
jgi:hypothetical protein